jgi:hypothetical protein
MPRASAAWRSGHTLARITQTSFGKIHLRHPMRILTIKFSGTPVADPENVQHAADRAIVPGRRSKL